MPGTDYTRGRPGTPGPGGSRPNAWTLQAVLNSLYSQPKSGQTWTHVLLASRTGLPVADVQDAFKVVRPLVQWEVYATILRELEADEDDVDVCQRNYRHLIEHFGQRNALPPDIAALTTEVRFMAALRSLKEGAGLSLRDLSEKMREEDPKHSWERSTLGRYLPKNSTDEAPLPTHRQRLRVLLIALCKHAGRPGDVDHFLMAWERLRSARNRHVHPGNASPTVHRSTWAREVDTTSTRTTPSVRFALLVAGLLAVVALIVLVVLVG